MHKFLPAFLAAQAILVHWAAGTERPPQSPDLKKFPVRLGEWQQLSDDPIDPGVQAQLHADRLMSRTYVQMGTPVTANVFIAWFSSQRGGASQPHSPQVCLPGSGWVPEIADEQIVDTAAGRIAVNRYIVSNHGFRAAVFYWYQMGSRAIPGEWSAKLWTIYTALTQKRTDTALVRIVVQPGAGDDKMATSIATRFAKDLYPIVLSNLPQ